MTKKSKSKAQIMVADGTGGMATVQDRRFEAGHWPIGFDVSREQADTWLRAFDAECETRGWNNHSVGQLEAGENSGSTTVLTSPATSQLAVVWERKRDRLLKVRARPTGTLEISAARAFLDQVNDRCRSGPTTQFYRRGLLEYHGLALCGEVWLDDMVRLGPPSQQYDKPLLGPCCRCVGSRIRSNGCHVGFRTAT